MWRTTRELVESEAQAQYNALHDALSGLANRLHFVERLKAELAVLVEEGGEDDVFVAYIDLDAFKTVNDTMGHHVGDELVKQVARRLSGRLPESDLIARLGGDEFVVLRRASGGQGRPMPWGARSSGSWPSRSSSPDTVWG
jgi:diguanylate cyclase (GGDEF)-like protein